jgi:hypothetical protein
MVQSDAQIEARPASRRTRLIPIRGVMPIVDRDEDAVLALIEDGQLRWAFDVALTKGQRTKELRVFPKCIGDFVAGRECKIGFEEVAAAMTRGESQALPATEIIAALNVSCTHAYNLIHRGELKQVSVGLRGPRESARVAVESFVRFLRERAYPVPLADT